MSQLEGKIIGYVVQRRKILDESDLFYHLGDSWEVVNQDSLFPGFILASQTIGIRIYHKKERAEMAMNHFDTQMGSVEFRIVPVFGTIEGM